MTTPPGDFRKPVVDRAPPRRRRAPVALRAPAAVGDAMNLLDVSPLLKDGRVRVIIETPQGSRNKLAYDPALQLFALSKTLPAGMVFPFDFGFIPRTRAEDGDPLDALVIMPESVAPGTVVACRIIGVIEVRQAEGKNRKGVRNDRYLAVSEAPGAFENLHHPGDLPGGMLEQLEEFFVNYIELEGGQLEVLGVQGPPAALAAIERAVHAWPAARKQPRASRR